MPKTIGTFAPLFSLWTKNQPKKQANMETASKFLNWLHKTNQTAWQLLPLHETPLVPRGKKNHLSSPYKGYGIGLDPKYLSAIGQKKIPSKKILASFIIKQKSWLPTYAFFCALRDHFETDNWTLWEKNIRQRNTQAIITWSNKLKIQIEKYLLQQWQLDQEYQKIRNKARQYNIKLIGDLSFYIPLQSPLVWKNQNLFQLNKNSKMTKVSGLPDGPQAHFGRQVWGHPLYNWQNESDNLLTLWKTRLNYIAQLFDIIRLDHAKGFYNYGSMHPTNPKLDVIKIGPGTKILEKILNYSRSLELKIFAEDSGDRLKTLRKTLHNYNISGIRILRFAYNEKRKKISKRYANMTAYPPNTIAQTTTHDTETLLGYLKLLSAEEKRKLSKQCHILFDTDNIILATRLRDTLINSPAEIVIIPIQDWLLSTKRINIPGTETNNKDPNWQYRIEIAIEDLPLKLF